MAGTSIQTKAHRDRPRVQTTFQTVCLSRVCIACSCTSCCCCCCCCSAHIIDAQDAKGRSAAKASEEGSETRDLHLLEIATKHAIRGRRTAQSSSPRAQDLQCQYDGMGECVHRLASGLSLGGCCGGRVGRSVDDGEGGGEQRSGADQTVGIAIRVTRQSARGPLSAPLLYNYPHHHYHSTHHQHGTLRLLRRRRFGPRPGLVSVPRMSLPRHVCLVLCPPASAQRRGGFSTGPHAWHPRLHLPQRQR